MTSLRDLNSSSLIGATRIKLQPCALTSIPSVLYDHCGTLEFLDLSGNNLSSLPDDFSRFSRLEIAFFSENAFTTFPAVLGRCSSLKMIAFKGNGMVNIPEGALPKQLRWLILTNNRITALPRSIGTCHRLEKLMLAGNQLSSLPDELSACESLGLLRISSNRITAIPSWLPRMPNLSWLAFSSNPCLPPPTLEAHHVLPDVSWAQIAMHEILGEGASGTIYRATLIETSTQVAVKLFKGEVTSDGLPSDEMDACILAGRHLHLIDPIGRIVDHPQNVRGLILQLIPSTYKVLGGPPNFDTCTRDAFPANMSLSLSSVLEMVYGIASVAAHLHDDGIAHGDLYCHNVLWNSHTSYALLGDFGAATVYGKDHPFAPFLQRVEASAFGKLLDDLLRHCRREDGQENVIAKLEELHRACVRPRVMARPAFGKICDDLKHMRGFVAHISAESAVLAPGIKVA